MAKTCKKCEIFDALHTTHFPDFTEVEGFTEATGKVGGSHVYCTQSIEVDLPICV